VGINRRVLFGKHCPRDRTALKKGRGERKEKGDIPGKARGGGEYWVMRLCDLPEDEGEGWVV